MEKPPLILIALYYLKSKEGEIPLSYPTLTENNLFVEGIRHFLTYFVPFLMINF